MDHYLSVIRACLEEGISPRCHLEDITRADIYGYVVPFCLELMKLMEHKGLASVVPGDYLPSGLALPRRQEIFACFNRYRAMKL